MMRTECRRKQKLENQTCLGRPCRPSFDGVERILKRRRLNEDPSDTPVNEEAGGRENGGDIRRVKPRTIKVPNVVKETRSKRPETDEVRWTAVTVSMGVPVQAIWAVAGRVSRGQWDAGGVANSAIEWDVRVGRK